MSSRMSCGGMALVNGTLFFVAMGPSWFPIVGRDRWRKMAPGARATACHSRATCHDQGVSRKHTLCKRYVRKAHLCAKVCPNVVL